MAAKYHINPETGRANICRAELRDCPLKREDGSPAPHFDNKADLKKYVEKTNEEMFGKGVDGMKRKPSKTVARNFGSETKTLDVTISSTDYLEHLVERENKRFERMGNDMRITFDVKERKVPVNKYSVTVNKTIYDVKITMPEAVYGGYKFHAVAEQTPGGVIVKSGRENVDWRPESMKCDHCGRNQRRNKTYLVTSPENEILQLGSSCVEDYLGYRPGGLNRIFDLEGELEEAMEERERSYHREGGSGISANDTVPKREILALALAVSDGGEDFVSNSVSWELGRSSTSEVMKHYLFGKPANDNERRYFDEISEKFDQYRESGAEVDELENLVDELEGESDYVQNMKAIASADDVRYKDFSMLVSILAEKRRRMKISQKKKIEFTPGYMLPVGESVKGKKLKVIDNKVLTSHGYTYYQDEVSYSLMTMQDEEGHKVTWFSSKVLDLKSGDELECSSGRVKAHEKYEGVDQTIVTRLRYKVTNYSDDENKDSGE